MQVLTIPDQAAKKGSKEDRLGSTRHLGTTPHIERAGFFAARLVQERSCTDTLSSDRKASVAQKSVAAPCMTSIIEVIHFDLGKDTIEIPRSPN